MRKLLLISATLILGLNSLYALQVGDPAPKLQVAKWLKNGPVDITTGKGQKLYVIEFWATWCPPCRQTIPHLSELQKKYKDQGVVIVGISNEKPFKVEKFVANQSNMNYNVAVDDYNKTTKAYMTGVPTIPFCFVVDKEGKIAWKGNPLDLDRVIKQVLDGTFDVDKQNKITAFRNKLQLAIQTGNEQEIIKFSDAILDLDPANNLALGVRLSIYERKRQYPEALQFINSQISQCPDHKALYFVKLNLLAATPDTIDKLQRSARETLDRFKGDIVALNQLAWMLMDKLPFGSTPVDVALEAAQLAVDALPADAEASQQAAFYDTLSRANYLAGLYDKAITNQQQAISHAKGTPAEKTLTIVLDYYKKVKALNKTLK